MTAMASFPLSWNNGFLVAQDKVNICVGNFGKHKYLPNSCIISVPIPLLLNYSPRKAQNRFLCCNKSKSVVNDKLHLENQLLREKKRHTQRRKFSLRLRPRIRLFLRKLKGGSIKSLLNSISTFTRKNAKKIAISTCVCLVIELCFLFLRITPTQSLKDVPYSHLITSLQSGSVSSVSFEEGTSRIFYNTKTWHERDDDVGRENLNEKSKRPSAVWEFSTRKIDQDMGYLLGLIRERGAVYGSAPQSALAAMRSMLAMVLMLWIPLTPLVWLFYRHINGSNGPAKKRKTSKRLVCFDDVEGVDSAKVELMEIVCCLQGSINYSKLGAKLPRGVLLVGPPGTGKTLLARAVAGEAGVPFFSVSASEFVEMFVGRGAARIRELFEAARKNAPSIVFIDELDAVGGRRGRSFNDERDQTLNQLLTEMDGFDSEINVVVIAATNRPESLDPALTRPGRFSRKVYVGQPDEDGRRKILAIHLRGVPLEEDIGLMCNLVSSLTQGLVGADLANIVNEAALLAARRGSESVSREDITEAVERAKFGMNGRMQTSISKKLEKLFPWMNEGMQSPLGYQTLS